MSMELPLKQRLLRKRRLHKKFVTIITKFTKKSMNGLIVILNILEEQPPSNKQR